MRIAIGGISHETSTFVKTPTTLKDFESGFGLFRGQQIIDRFTGANICAGGFIDGANKHGFEIVPLLWTFAYPSGVIVRDDYELLKSEFLRRLQDEEAARGPVDGVLLDLHGAMVVEGIDDGDGDFIAAVREFVGADRPIVVTHDLHGNHSQHRVEQADAIIGFDTYPHVDMAERGREAADLIVATIRGDVRPVMALRQLPLFWNVPCQVTALSPMSELIRRAHELETRAGILSVTVATGFPWADVPDMGASVIVVADNDDALARGTADELGDWIWENRQRWSCAPVSVVEAIERGESGGQFPIVLADHADNTGGGSPGDSTEVLRTFIERKLSDAVILYIVDPEVVEQTHAAGVGSQIAVSVGGKSDPVQGPPVEMDVRVMALSDGDFTYDGPMYAGLTGNMGRSAWLQQDGVSVVVVTAHEQPLGPAFARTLGIDCERMRYIAVKSAAHFRASFERFAGVIINVDAQAIQTHDFAKLKYHKRHREFFPVEITS
ncbi:MAG: M81 family metallopeptidase [Planctomycetales bacterium]|nr:M81 family metallopeptidase [Planctomycetales bacterium]